MKNFTEKLVDIEQRKLEVATSRGVLSVQQTQRNAIKKELIEAIFVDLQALAKTHGITTYMTGEGPILSLENESVEDQVYRMDPTGEYNTRIAIQFDIKIKNLNFDPQQEEEYFLAEQEKRRHKQEEQERLKEAKIKRDAEGRAQKARERERKIAALVKLKEEVSGLRD